MNPQGLLKLGGSVHVSIRGVELPNPPTKSTAILLIGLYIERQEWSNRKELARKLFPDTETKKRDDAFRQTLLRLRRWVGEDALDFNRSYVRLTPGFWESDLSNPEKFTITPDQIAEGIEHPWLNELRQKVAGRTNVAFQAPAKSFSQTVLAVATLDIEVARSILIGGDYLINLVPRDEVLNILKATEPTAIHQSLSTEHTLLCANVLARFCFIRESYQKLVEAYRMAAQKREKAHALSAAAWATYISLDCGEMEDAKTWFEIISQESFKQKRLALVTAQLSYHWMNGDTEKGWESIELGRSIVNRAERRIALHFWANSSIFASEFEDPEFALLAIEKAKSLLVPGLDFWFMKNYWLAEAWYLLCTGSYASAISILDSQIKLSDQDDSPFHGLYFAQAKAEALARMGHIEDGLELWQQCEQIRLDQGGKINHLARVKARILNPPKPVTLS
jgi:tetratricopeptide (TPR) repeat protein